MYKSYTIKAPLPHATRPNTTVWISVGYATAQADETIRVRINSLPLTHTGWNGELVLFLNENKDAQG